MDKKIAVVLFNLGGPEDLQSVKPFLFNLFADPAIIGLPKFFRIPLATFISWRREKTAQEIYSHIGGGSPLNKLTKEQADALEKKLREDKADNEYKVFIAMRYWHPYTTECVEQVLAYGADEVILLPLYPQFSTTTTGSSVNEWHKVAKKSGLDIPTKTVCCYPFEKDFIQSHVSTLKACYEQASKSSDRLRILFSAHGLPKKIVDAGDPYQWQIEQTAQRIMDTWGAENIDWQVCYQSKVGPLEWIGPSAESEIERAGKESVGLVIVPIAFVSEHSETLVELDIEYKELADEHKVPSYNRVPALATQEDYITSLTNICLSIDDRADIDASCGRRVCPSKFVSCLNN